MNTEPLPLDAPTGVRCYIDGFNLYHGALYHTDLKWLDPIRLATELAGVRPDVTRFFTARVKSLPWDKNAPQRQDVYLRALRVTGVAITEGQFQLRDKEKRLSEKMPGFRPMPRRVRVFLPEEKGSDVNLASYLLKDAYEHELLTAVVITNDSDLVEPIRMVLERGVKVVIANPHKTPAKALRAIAADHRTVEFMPIYKQALKRSQLSNPVVDPKTGDEIHRPAQWGRRQS